MKSNYKRLGPYIQQVDIRNKDDNRNNLLGVSVTKDFIKSIANTVGTDFTQYKIVKKYQFTYIPDTSRRGDKIAIALLKNEDEGLVSQAYTVFEVSDTDNLLPEYLMMWFRRPEFDRYARYKSHGSVREIFSWDEMCDVELPIPSIMKQREIVKQYNLIENRINLNSQFIAKLEEMSQAIYKHWFDDFEFPDDNGMPYKSSGGEMEFNTGLYKEIPIGWILGELSDIVNIIMGQSPKGETYNTEESGMPLVNGPVEFGEYFVEKTKWTTSPTKVSKENDLIVCVRGSTIGRFVKSDGNYCLGRGVCSFRAKRSQEFIDQFYKDNINKMVSITTGSTFPSWDRQFLFTFPIVIPSPEVEESFEKVAVRISNYIKLLSKEKIILSKIKQLLLSKLSIMEEGQ